MYYNPYDGVPYVQYDIRNIMDLCERYKNFYVLGHLANGTQVEGIIMDMDDNHVTMLVPEIVEEEQLNNQRQNGWSGGYGYGGYGGYGRRRYRRFRRRRFPYRQFIFPFIVPFPFFF